MNFSLKPIKVTVILLECILLQFFAFPLSAQGHTGNSNSKEAFYNAFSSNSLTKVNDALAQTSSNSGTVSRAHKGALLMKKAGFLKQRKEQLDNFKEGRTLLESAIAQEPQNAEFRFMRIAIQEKAPRILGYNKNIKEDKQLLIKAFSQLDEVAKSAIAGYAKTSSALYELIH